MAALGIRKAAGLDLRKGRSFNPVPAVRPIYSMGVDQRDPRDQAAGASDDIRLVHGELTEPTHFRALKFCQNRCLQPPGSLILLGATPSGSGPVTASVGDTIA